MSTEKCFCHLNGYAVKDSTARESITKIDERIKSLENLKLKDGREIALQKNASAGYIQWRYTDESVWHNLIALSDLKGADGKDGTNGTNGKDGTNGTNGTDGREVEFQKGETHIQWRYVGESSWNDLIALSEITGSDGTGNGESSVLYRTNLITTGIEKEKILGGSSVIAGNSNSMGYQISDTVYGQVSNNIIGGSGNDAQANNLLMFGIGNIAQFHNQMVGGQYNSNFESSILELGNGYVSADGVIRRNAMRVSKKGRIYSFLIEEALTNTSDNDVLIRKEVNTLINNKFATVVKNLYISDYNAFHTQKTQFINYIKANNITFLKAKFGNYIGNVTSAYAESDRYYIQITCKDPNFTSTGYDSTGIEPPNLVKVTLAYNANYPTYYQIIVQNAETNEITERINVNSSYFSSNQMYFYWI